MKKFKNERWVINGPVSLLKAFKEELDTIGIREEKCWNYSRELGVDTERIILGSHTEGYGYYSTTMNDYKNFYLPQDWQEALDYVSEEVKEIPEYVECIVNNFSYYLKGQISKVDDKGQIEDLDGEYTDFMKWPRDKKCFKPSTKEAYEAQKPKLEVGRWYKKNTEGIAYYGGKFPQCYGINSGEKWVNGVYWFHDEDDWIEASKEEVQEALVAEAKRRGFKKGVTIAKTGINNNLGFTPYPISGRFMFYPSDNLLDSNGQGYVFKDGEWAEPIDTTPDIIINNYKAEFFSDYVQFGCARISKEAIGDIIDAIEDKDLEDTGFGNRAVTGIQIGTGLFTIPQLREIHDYFYK